MKYLVCTAGPQDMYIGKHARILLEGVKIDVPLVEFGANPVIPVEKLQDLSEPQRRELIAEAIRQGQRSIAGQLRRAARLAAVDNPEFLTILVYTMPACLSADDVVDGKLVNIGWAMWTEVGFLPSATRPDCFDPVDGDEVFPFWAADPRVPPDPMAYLQTEKGKAKLAQQLGVCLGYGPAPPGAKTPTELDPSLIPQE